MSIERIAVEGAGVMGRDIAHVGALGGFEVRLHDADAGALEGALRGIEGEMKKAVERGKLDEEGMREGLGRISAAGDLAEAVADADLVIEAVLERMDLKLSLFGQFDELCPEHAVLATNTSTMSPTEIAAGIERPASASPCISSTRRTR